jgi:hypothetical protein
MAENKTAKTPTDGGAGFIDGVWSGPWYGPGPSCISSKPAKQWVGLTDEETDELSRSMVKGDKSVNWLCRAIEAKLKERNT